MIDLDPPQLPRKRKRVPPFDAAHYGMRDAAAIRDDLDKTKSAKKRLRLYMESIALGRMTVAHSGRVLIVTCRAGRLPVPAEEEDEEPMLLAQ